MPSSHRFLCLAVAASLAVSVGAPRTVAADLPLMPLPQSVTAAPGSLAITDGFSISVSGAGANDDRVRAAVQRTFRRIQRQTGIPLSPHLPPAGQDAVLRIAVEQQDHPAPQKLGDDESYSLEIGNAYARLSATQPLGALRGIETFLQLIQQNASAEHTFSAACVHIQDSPRFPWRGLSLDVSRHFIPVPDVERTLDGMAAVKLNVFHWHLSDDQGFRVESKKYPKIQQLASEGKYYTQAQVREVIVYARGLGIRVVPEFDMPGHAASLLAAYPMLAAGPGPQMVAHNFGILTRLMDPTKESTYRFLDGLVGEMAELFPDEYFHIGGDEVQADEWNKNPEIQAFMQQHKLASAKDLQTYFSQRLVKIVIRHGKRVEGWDEVLQPDLPKTILIQSWRGQGALWQAASQGFDGILSANYYLNLMQSAAEHYAIDPMKMPPATEEDRSAPKAAVPPSLTPEQSKHLLGGEAAMWEELTMPENLDAKLWPRLAVIAERLWSAESVTDVGSMYRRLATTNEWLQYLGLSQRFSLELMRQRLAGTFPYAPLDTFSSILEPLKGYDRDADKYLTETPLNRLVDSIAPESDAAREFRDQVDVYLAAPAGQRNSELLRRQLAAWQQSAADVRPMMQANALLTADLPVADAVATLCQSAQEALTYLDSGRTADAAWKPRTKSAATAASGHIGDILVQIAPGVQRLIAAVPD